jgi:hypothetical protein
MTFKIDDCIVFNEKKWIHLESYRYYLIHKRSMHNLLILDEQMERYHKNQIFIVSKIPSMFGTFEATYNGELCTKLKTKDFELATWEQTKKYHLREIFKNK